ncbi:MAG: FAD-binding oxidoreductase [Desulfobacterales bacterium]|nr:FAD-binding oxidoreductase [Desulfobacterales bacterium]
MKDRNADVVVVGGGIVGCSTAYYLAKRGVSVVVCEKGDVGLEQSSRNWGFVRQQGRDEAELPLMMACNRIWQSLEAELEADLEWIQGGNIALAYNHERLGFLEQWLPIAKEHGLETSLLSAQQLRKLVPAAKSNLLGAMFTSSDGQAEPQKVCPAFQRAAKTKGARFMTGCAVERIEIQNGSVSGVYTEHGYIRTSTVVCAAGAWSTRLMRPLGVRLPSLWIKGSVARVAPVRTLTPAGVWGRTAFRQRSDGRLYMALGVEGEHDLMIDSLRFFPAYIPVYLHNRKELKLKLGRVLIDDLFGRYDDFSRHRALDPQPSRKEIEQAVRYMQAEYEGLKSMTIERMWAGYMDCTPDMLPVIDALTRPRGLVLATGFSGHGFGMGPIVGKMVSEIILDAKPSLDLNALRFSRFKEGIKTRSTQVV